MGKEKILVGMTKETKQGCKIEVVDVVNCNNITVRFEDTGFLKQTTMNYFRLGVIRNPYRKSVHGVGYIGETTEIISNKNHKYSQWSGLLYRGYSKKFKDNNPSYKDVIVCEEWHNYQVFAEWFEANYNPEIMDGWHLDKDILIKGNKIYSPEMCCFVPQEINKLFCKSNSTRGDFPIGVKKANKKYESYVTKKGKNIRVGLFNTPEEAFQAYKIAKEEHIKEIANKWKELIDPKVYEALINYQVEITD